ncbi:hypothetical protein [Aeromicrobium panaciterrae]|uniref:hypothetical protein n=1 Tax=Aeromicrobium panaciterrae TaxID=363861 RepID=UPI0031CFE949
MRSPRNVLIAAGVLLVVGVLLVHFDSSSINGMSTGPGDSADGFSSEVSFAFDNAWLITRQSAIGYALMWLGTLLAAGVVGHRLVTDPASGESV